MGDHCSVCGEQVRYEIAHSCAGASNLPERSHGLVSLATMEARIAEAVAAEQERCAEIAHMEEYGICTAAARRIVKRIQERAK